MVSETEEVYCWPCFGIITNLSTDSSHDNPDTHNTDYWMRKLSHFKPLKFSTFLNANQSIDKVVVAFKSDWSGFKNAMEFEKMFEARGRGRDEWIQRKASPGSRLYAWVAREDDYKSDGPLGEFLRCTVGLKTFTELVQEATTNRGKILCELVKEIELRNKNLNQLQTSFLQNKMSALEMLGEQEKMFLSLNEATTKLECITKEHVKGVVEEQEMLKFELERKRKRFDSWRKDLSKCEEALNASEGRIREAENMMVELIKREDALVEREKRIMELENKKSDLTRRMLQMATEERRKADENVGVLTEVRKREKEAVKKVLELEQKLGEKHKLETEIEELKDQLNSVQNLYRDLMVNEQQCNDELQGARKELMKREKEAVEKVLELEQNLGEKHKLETEIEELKDQLNGVQNLYRDLMVNKQQCNDELQGARKELMKREKEAVEKVLELEQNLGEKHKLEMEIEELKDQLNGVQNLCRDLMVNERQCNDELQGARKELIKGLRSMKIGHRSTIGTKRMGEIDPKAFKNTCNQRFPPEDAETKALELCSLWQERLKNPMWHPFQVIENESGTHQRLLNEDDELLRGLKDEWGDEIYDAVVTSLKDLQEYNPSGCYLVSEFWNFKENRKATLKEVIGHVCTQLKTFKRKRL